MVNTTYIPIAQINMYNLYKIHYQKKIDDGAQFVMCKEQKDNIEQ